MSQDGFKCNPETNILTITSLSQMRISHSQIFFKVGVLKNFTLVFSREYYKTFKSNVFIKNPGGCFFQLHKVIVQHWASADLLFLIKNAMWDGFY